MTKNPYSTTSKPLYRDYRDHWEEADFERFDAAKKVLEAWMVLSVTDRHGAIGDALFSTFKTLLPEPEALHDLYEAGYESALVQDDPIAFRRFIELGVKLPSFDMDSNSRYEEAWDSGMSLWCIKHRKLKCFEALLDMGVVDTEYSWSEGRLKVPKTSPLSGFSGEEVKALLIQKQQSTEASGIDGFSSETTTPQPALSQEDHDLADSVEMLQNIHGLFMESQIEVLSSEIRRGNPLFALLWFAADGESPEASLDLLDRLAFKHKLLDIEHPAYTFSLLKLVSEGSVGALFLSLKAGLTTDDFPDNLKQPLARSLAGIGTRTGPGAKYWRENAPTLFKGWITQAKDDEANSLSISERMLHALIVEASDEHVHRHPKALKNMQQLIQTWIKPASNYGFDQAPSAYFVDQLKSECTASLMAIEDKLSIAQALLHQDNTHVAAREVDLKKTHSRHLTETLNQVMTYLNQLNASALAKPTLRV